MATLEQKMNYLNEAEADPNTKRVIWNDIQSGKYNETALKEGIDISDYSPTFKKPEPSYIKKVKESASEGLGTFMQGIKSGDPFNQETSIGEKFVQAPSDIIRGATDIALSPLAPVVGSVVKSGIENFDLKSMLKTVNPVLSPIIDAVPDEILNEIKQSVATGVTEVSDKVKQFAEQNPTAYKGARMLFDVASLGVGGEGAKVAEKILPIAKDLIEEGVGRGVSGGIKGAKKIGGVVKESLIPVNTTDEALKQIGQGTTKTLEPLESTLRIIDTKKVNTFGDLLKNIENKIPDLSKKVDDELLKDKGVYKLPQLALTETTKEGQKVATNYVMRSIEDLKNLYKTIGDNVSLTEIINLDNKLKNVGLTRKEVNDLSRIYGQEFSDKAFSKTGDALTSVNAQAFENTRTGLKGTARQGIGGKEAQLLDSQLSDLYDTKKLIEKNVEAVNKLRQRIQKRGLLEKVANKTVKLLDTMSAGTIRGAIGGLLPRGVGYKMMNALDIEEALRKNLDIFEKALKTKTNDEFIQIIDTSFKK